MNDSKSLVAHTPVLAIVSRCWINSSESSFLVMAPRGGLGGADRPTYNNVPSTPHKVANHRYSSSQLFKSVRLPVGFLSATSLFWWRQCGRIESVLGFVQTNHIDQLHFRPRQCLRIQPADAIPPKRALHGSLKGTNYRLHRIQWV